MNKEICQIVDSAGNLPNDFIEKYNIVEVLFYFKFQEKYYFKEKIDYQVDEFYKYMKDEPGNIPKTAVLNLNDWIEVFEEQYSEDYKKFIVTTISSKF